MSHILAVLGATGIQGGSLIDYVLNDPELSQKYQIRAISRNVSLDKAVQLKNKVEVVQADVSDPVSIETALTGAHTVFAMTVPSFAPNGLEVEFNHGKTIADAAVRQGVKYLIFSTLPAVNEISGGKYRHVTPFDAKAKIEQYIRSLPIKSAFVSFGFFMQNLHTQPFLGPVPGPEGTWVLARPAPPTSRIPYIDAVANVGNVVGSILAEPEKYEGKTFCAAERLYSLEEIAALLSRATGKTVVYKQVTLEEFKNSITFAPDLFADGFCFSEEFGGYWGPDSGKSVAWAIENTRGRLRTLEEYLEANPIQLS
ncbi:hypothetical protein EIK77_001643 [Talaromyces pinophilus]|nr:hypothetical protein EIK77_001643 [Talaromyces pinophilus]PCH07106.1 Hypothetical protein PENO1_013990 [Penicillium occitanis (nom. inval.)]PCH08315.1 hypothetical protein PENOC_015250 [Penicillium occitanis (nom. inval.)]